MNFKQWLMQEMPMASYNVGYLRPDLTDDEKHSSLPTNVFNARDRKAMQTPAMVKKLEQVLSRTGYKFNIILMEAKSNKSSFDKEVQEYIKEKNIQLPGHITYVKNSTTGHALTPWMMLHTIGHAIFNDNRDIYHSRLHKLLTSVDLLHINPASFFKFISARATDNRKVEGLSELIYELVAEYLWHGGKIRWQIPPDKQSYPGIEKIGEYLVQKVTETIEELLQKSVGKIIYDFYAA